MPDIDMDFDSRYRDEMIRYAAERYGRDHVAQIVTFSTIKARAAVRDAARVLGYPYAVGDKVAKAMPPLVMGRDTPLYACLEQHPKFDDGYKRAAELREMYEDDPDAKRGRRRGQGPRGPAPPGRHPRRRGGHHRRAAHRVPADPAQARARPGPSRTRRSSPSTRCTASRSSACSRWTSWGCATSTSSPTPSQIIRDSRGVELDIDDVAPRRRAHLRAAAQRATRSACSSWRAAPMRALMRSLAPTAFEDVAALVALYRPGPMAANMHNDYADRKNGRKPVEYLHPDAEEMLGDTYGLMIYQESMMRVAQKFAGYSLAEADNLRKACGKKKRELMAKERAKFVEGCEATGYGADLGTALFDIIEPFADYAFNKRHAYGYGLVAYQTAYLKANYPVEYLAALLTSVKANLEKAAVYLAECRAMGITVAGARRQPVAVRLHAGPQRRRGRHRGPSIASACRRCATWARAWSRLIVAERERQRALRRLLRLLRPGRLDGAQQADHRVADQGRRVRRARPPAQGPAHGLRADRRPDARPPARGGHGHHDPVRGDDSSRRRQRLRASVRRSPTSSSTRPSGSPSRRRCSAST